MRCNGKIQISRTRNIGRVRQCWAQSEPNETLCVLCNRSAQPRVISDLSAELTNHWLTAPFSSENYHSSTANTRFARRSSAIDSLQIKGSESTFTGTPIDYLHMALEEMYQHNDPFLNRLTKRWILPDTAHIRPSRTWFWPHEDDKIPLGSDYNRIKPLRSQIYGTEQSFYSAFVPTFERAYLMKKSGRFEIVPWDSILIPFLWSAQLPYEKAPICSYPCHKFESNPNFVPKLYKILLTYIYLPGSKLLTEKQICEEILSFLKGLAKRDQQHPIKGCELFIYRGSFGHDLPAFTMFEFELKGRILHNLVRLSFGFDMPTRHLFELFKAHMKKFQHLNIDKQYLDPTSWILKRQPSTLELDPNLTWKSLASHEMRNPKFHLAFSFIRNEVLIDLLQILSQNFKKALASVKENEFAVLIDELLDLNQSKLFCIYQWIMRNGLNNDIKSWDISENLYIKLQIMHESMSELLPVILSVLPTTFLPQPNPFCASVNSIKFSTYLTDSGMHAFIVLKTALLNAGVNAILLSKDDYYEVVRLCASEEEKIQGLIRNNLQQLKARRTQNHWAFSVNLTEAPLTTRLDWRSATHRYLEKSILETCKVYSPILFQVPFVIVDISRFSMQMPLYEIVHVIYTAPIFENKSIFSIKPIIILWRSGLKFGVFSLDKYQYGEIIVLSQESESPLVYQDTFSEEIALKDCIDKKLSVVLKNLDTLTSYFSATCKVTTAIRNLSEQYKEILASKLH